MMSRKKYVVELSSDEREHLAALISKGKSSAQAILKARILLKADQGPLRPSWTDERIVEALDSNASMVMVPATIKGKSVSRC
jgi:arsenate reductase-like glutaredoxin family protein